MLAVPSLDLGGLYRQNLNSSQSFAFQQQNQIPTIAGPSTGTGTATSASTSAASTSTAKEPFQTHGQPSYDGPPSVDTSGSSTDLSKDAEDSSNMIAGIITKICFDLSSENQQQLQVAHSVGLRVYEALSGKMNQYRLELLNLRRVIQEKDRRIQLLESLQQTRHPAQIQMSKFAASPTPASVNPATTASGIPLLEQHSNPNTNSVAAQKQFKMMQGLTGNSAALTHTRTAPGPDQGPGPGPKRKSSQGTRRKASSGSNTGRSRKKMKLETSKSRRGVKGESGVKSRKNGGDALNRWTKKQDSALKAAVRKYDGRNWKAIAQEVDGRDHVQCLQRWKKVLQPGLVKGHWTPEEDEKLLRLIQDKEMHSWAMVAENIEGRTAKQCRERWSLNLDPSINRSPWTLQEDALLLKLYAEIGGKWAEIKQQFDGRTENAVKTRYKSIMRAKAREWTPEQDEKLVMLRKKFGKDWARIAKGLPGRSKNAIKVRCKTLAETNPIMRSLEYPHLENAPTLNMGLKRETGGGKGRKKVGGI